MKKEIEVKDGFDYVPNEGIKRNTEGNRFSRYFVRTSNAYSREQLLIFLDNKGYKCIEDDITNKQIVLDSVYPITVDTENKAYGVIHTTTCAAAAVSSRAVLEEDEFYVLFKGCMATYDEYLNVIKRLFLEYDYTVEERDEFFARGNIQEILKSNYKEYCEGIAGCEPRATASCLDLMYE